MKFLERGGEGVANASLEFKEATTKACTRMISTVLARVSLKLEQNGGYMYLGGIAVA